MITVVFDFRHAGFICYTRVALKNSLLYLPPTFIVSGSHFSYQVIHLFCIYLFAPKIITVHDQDVQTFIDDQQGQIIIITVVVEGATGPPLRSKCQLAFHSRSFRVRDSRCGRESPKQQVRDKVARPVNRFHSHRQNS